MTQTLCQYDTLKKLRGFFIAVVTDPSELTVQIK